MEATRSALTLSVVECTKIRQQQDEQSGRHPVNIRPLRDRVPLRRSEEAETRTGGIAVPDIARETEITLDGTESLIVREDPIPGVIQPVHEPVAAWIQSTHRCKKEETTWP
jgi:hypothetical protein